MATFEERKTEIQKIFNEPSRSTYEQMVISATTDVELTQAVTDYISDSDTIITFEDKKTFFISYCELKHACSSEGDKVTDLADDTEMAQIMADNFLWFNKIK